MIGLEVHVQLKTQSKLFCRCSTAFGASLDTQTCPVCIGMPGSVPVMNHKAYQLALQTALALNCEIAPFTKWDRKNYYYPDLPKGIRSASSTSHSVRRGWLDIAIPKAPIHGDGFASFALTWKKTQARISTTNLWQGETANGFEPYRNTTAGNCQ